MTTTQQLASFTVDNQYCFYDSNVIRAFSTEMLSAQYWQNINAITGSAQGRGTTWFVRYVDPSDSQYKHWVLRHYYRGGLIGKIIHDSYFFTSLNNTRAAQEYALLAHMHTLGLPVPKPIAYRIVRKGLFYQADLLSTRIENAQDLVAILSKQNLSSQLWQHIGATIKRFHDNNIYHHDLNVHNVLIDNQDQVFVIDFDCGAVRASNQQNWKKSNLARLHRSFLKEADKLPNFNWCNDHWQLLLDGYLSRE